MAIPTRLFSGICEISTGAFTPLNTSPAFQGEAQAISMQVDFMQNGAPYNIPEDVTVYRYLYYDAQASHTTAMAMEKDGSMASALLTEQEQSLPGTPYLCITMLDAEGNKIVSFATRIEIRRLLGKTIINTLPPEALEAAIAAANIATAKANIAADRAELAALNPPIPTEDNTWAVWDAETESYIDTDMPSALPGPTGPQGQDGPQGIQGQVGPQGPEGPAGRGFTILGQYDTLPDLHSSVPSPAIGDMYYIGPTAPRNVFRWDGAEWIDDGKMEGPQGQKGDTGEQGPPGENGADGESAYEIAVRNGFVGTEAEWLRSLAGVDAATVALPAGSWTLNDDLFEQVASHGIFAADGYIYDMAPVPVQIFDVAGFGGIVLAEPIADGSAIFQCPSLPDIEINMQIRRMTQKEDA